MPIPGYYNVTSSSSLYVRAGPSTSSSTLGSNAFNTRLYVTQEQNGWAYVYRVNDQDQQDEEQFHGWSSIKYLAEAETLSIERAEEPTDTIIDEESVPEGSPDTGDAVLPYLNFEVFEVDETSRSDAYTIRNAMQIIGLPYQFLPTADRSLTKDGASLGRKYANRIISRMPLLLMQPGKPKFLKKYTDAEKKNVLEAFFRAASGNDTAISNIVDREGRYYAFEADWKAYYDFVNPLCRIASRYLGVAHHTYHDVPLELLNWGGVMNTKTESFRQIPLYGAVPFYINSDTSWGDNIGNQTTESQLASTVNGISDMGRELSFITGYGSHALGAEFDIMNQQDVATNIQNVEDMISRILGNNGLSNIAKNLTSNLITVASGGKLIFPEIWADSDYSRSFDFSLRFVSPDSDPLSIYFNIIVPIIFCLGFTAPHSVDNNPNGYVAPFLVRAIYKGAFNCDMGIITNMSVTRGGSEQEWTREGLPTTVDVNFTIKDLYSALSITPIESGLLAAFKNAWNFTTVNNTALMDWIANICGINIYEPDIVRNIKMWFTQNFKSAVSDAVLYRFWDELGQRFQRFITDTVFGY